MLVINALCNPRPSKGVTCFRYFARILYAMMVVVPPSFVFTKRLDFF